jgi:hypothetical protein
LGNNHEIQIKNIQRGLGFLFLLSGSVQAGLICNSTSTQGLGHVGGVVISSDLSDSGCSFTQLTGTTYTSESDIDFFTDVTDGDDGDKTGTLDLASFTDAIIVVKFGQYYNLYTQMGLDSLDWTTDNPNVPGMQKEMSHISVYTSQAPTFQAVPIPGAAWLFGSGLIGLIRFRIKQGLTA